MPVFCRPWGFGLGLLCWALLLLLAIWWWKTTPLVAFALLLLVPIITLWLVLLLGGLGRWGRITESPIWPPWRGCWWLVLLCGLLSFVLGILALIDGSESRAGVLAILLGALFVLVGVPQMMRHVFLAPPLWFLILLSTLVGLGGILSVLGFLAKGRPVGASVVLLGSVWLLVAVLAPSLRLIRAGVPGPRLHAAVTPLLLISTLVCLMPALILLVVEGYEPSIDSSAIREAGRDATGEVDSSEQSDTGSETESKTATSLVDAERNPSGDEPDDEDPPDGDQDGDEPVEQIQNYFVNMSDGRQFPVYLFDSGSETELGIIIDRQEDCWLLQYGPDSADQIGQCLPSFLPGSVPDEGVVRYESATRLVVLIRGDADLLVTDFFNAQGQANDLDTATFPTIDASAGQFEIEGEAFSG